MSVGETLQPLFDRVQTYALFAGAGGLAVCAATGVIWAGAMFPAYLVAYLFWFGIAMGCLCLSLIHNLVGGYWGLMLRRLLEAGALMMVPLAVLFVPILIGLNQIYPWAVPEVVNTHELVKHKEAYLNGPAFILRAGIGFVIWITLAWLNPRGTVHRNSHGHVAKGSWLYTLSGPGLLITAVTGSLAAIDWGMSLDPDWYSTIYGVMVMIGWGLLTFATLVLTTYLLTRVSADVRTAATPGRLQDVGNLMLAFTMLWAYMSFSQYLITWAGNLTEEIPWYLRRNFGAWKVVVVLLMAVHFLVPFLGLLFRETKRKVENLVIIAVIIIVMHLIDLTWLVLPGGVWSPLHHASGSTDTWESMRNPWGSIALIPFALAGIGGIAVWSFIWQLRRRPLVVAQLLPSPPHSALGERS
jgi:protein-S-isoprenylcysteine O-methyltransferase Ste14